MGRKKKPDAMPLISFHVPSIYVAVLDELVKQGVYLSRSEAVRTALAKLLEKYRPDNKQ